MAANSAATLTGTRALLALCVAVVLAGTVWSGWDMFTGERRPLLQGWDDSFYYYWLPSTIIDGDVDFSNQLAHSGTIESTAQADAAALPPTATGKLPNKYPPGWALAGLPFFAVVHAFTGDAATGFEPAYLVAVWLGQLCYAALGVWLAIKIAARYAPTDVATTAVLITWLASPLVYYQSARLGMPHSLVFTLAMLVFWTAFRVNDGDARIRWWTLLGLAAALLVVTRNVAVVYLVWPAIVVLRRLRSWRAAVALAAGGGPVIAVQLVAWKALYGSWLVYSYGGERFNFGELHLAEILFSARHGWFYWHPLLLVGIAAFGAWAWRSLEGRAWLASLAGILVLNAAWPTWWLGSSFGHRGFEVATLFAAIGLARGWSGVRYRPALRRIGTVVIAACVSWNLVLLALFLTQRISREQPVTHAEAARTLVRWMGDAASVAPRPSR